MNCARRICLFLPFFAIAALLIAGCASQAPRPEPEPVAETPPRPEAEPAPPAEDLTRFGDPYDDESQYENRLVTNMTQHTFASIGRDFDPDLLSDGETMVFASTRNSEHPDIFLKSVNGYAITQLTSDPADDIQPRFSPDGTEVVFASNRSGNWDVWRIGCDGSALTQLTHDRTDEIAPCFSPDGKRVAFTVWGLRSHQWEIWVLDIDRPGVRRFLSYGMFPAWSPDGRHIAFQRARQRGTRWFSVWTIELDGNEVRHPTELAYSDGAACIAPRWSPDGKALVYCTASRNGPAGGAADVWTVDLATGVRMKLTDGATPAFNPTWSSTGRIYFVTARSGVENVWSLGKDDQAIAATPPQKKDATLSQVMINRPLAAGGE